MQHVVWDWNGTLLDDQHVVVEALNDALAHTDVGRVTAERYRELYTRPLPLFYRRLLGREVPPDEWDRIDDTFHASYRRRLEQAAPADDAEAALRLAADAGLTQSLLSMWRHDELLAMVRRLGIDRWLTRVDGLRGAGGGRKVDHLRRHLAALGLASDPAAVLVVGDAIDDADAARAVGAACVLVDAGSHRRADLTATGAPVVEDLVSALAVAGVDQADRTASTAGPSRASGS